MRFVAPARALADARSGVFSDTEGERDGRSGRPRGEALAADEVEGEVGGDEPGDELDADAPPERAAQLFPVLRLRDGAPLAEGGIRTDGCGCSLKMRRELQLWALRASSIVTP